MSSASLNPLGFRTLSLLRLPLAIGIIIPIFLSCIIVFLDFSPVSLNFPTVFAQEDGDNPSESSDGEGSQDVEGDQPEGKKKDPTDMDQSIMCKFLPHKRDIIDWEGYANLLGLCSYDNDNAFRLNCPFEPTIAVSLKISSELWNLMREEELELLCPNGAVQASSLSLAHYWSEWRQLEKERKEREDKLSGASGEELSDDERVFLMQEEER
jgi:hypothetical protein